MSNSHWKRAPRNPLYAVLVDFKAVFGWAPRDKVIFRLAEVDVPMNVLNLRCDSTGKHNNHGQRGVTGL